MRTIDTRDLATEREDLKQTILDSFLETFPHYEDMTDTFEDIRLEEEEIESWKEDFIDELETIEAIDTLEDDINSYAGDNFDDGVQLIYHNDFEEYCQELLEDCGEIPTNLPAYIERNINWSGVAEDLKVDYAEVDYLGTTYYFR